MSTRPRLAILSFSRLISDARVLRQIELFTPDYEVTTLGYGPAPDGVARHLQIPDEVVSWHKDRRLLLLRRFRAAYTSSPVVVSARGLLEAAVDTSAHSGAAFDAVLANDADSLPLALDLGLPVHADLHEYSPRQNENSPRWRWFVAPYYRWLIRTYAPRAASVTTVGEALAQEYRREYGLDAGVVVNAAGYADREPGPVHEPLRLVHSGAARRNRHLEIMVEAVAAMQRPVTLAMYLVPNDPAYLAELKERAASVPGISFPDPVPPGQLPEVLAEHDIGVFVLPPVTFNYEYSLPNKFFDYVQARLAIVVGPSPEMAALVRRYGMGVVTADYTAGELARELDGLSQHQVADMKTAAHGAAWELSAQEQVTGWAEAVAALVRRP